MRFISDVYWDVGKRETNQDSVSLQEVSVKGRKVVFALVCDGIGGLEGGETASGFVAEKMTEWFYREALIMLKRHKGRRKIENAGLRILYGCNEEMMQEGKKKGIKFGTTVTALLLSGRHYFLWHSGDTRAYRMKGKGRLKRLTEDHIENAHTLIRCIGSFPWKRPDVKSGCFIGKCTFLLCSDGFRNRADEKRIEELLLPETIQRREQIYKRLKEMAEYVKRKGERDNISAVAIKAE